VRWNSNHLTRFRSELPKHSTPSIMLKKQLGFIIHCIPYATLCERSVRLSDCVITCELHLYQGLMNFFFIQVTWYQKDKDGVWCSSVAITFPHFSCFESFWNLVTFNFCCNSRQQSRHIGFVCIRILCKNWRG
jgi:hypothetical protein